MFNDTKRVVLGTAQLGMEYGLANKVGKPSYESAFSILKTAFENGVCQYDTAQIYGGSEVVLGRSFKRLGIEKEVSVITKLSHEIKANNENEVFKAVQKSIKRLGVEQLEGVLLHQEELLDNWDNGIGEALRKCINKGMIKCSGVSVYSPEYALKALQMEDVDIVQIPASIIDRRCEQKSVFRIADKMGKRIYIRSIFFQGVLLLSPNQVPKHLNFVTPILERLHRYASDVGKTVHELVLSYAKYIYPSGYVLFGAETTEQVKDNLRLWMSECPIRLLNEMPKVVGCVDDKYLSLRNYATNNS